MLIRLAQVSALAYDPAHVRLPAESDEPVLIG
jgi:hypothetical protein